MRLKYPGYHIYHTIRFVSSLSATKPSKNIVLSPQRFNSCQQMKTFAELNFPGRLIAVEGLDGSGKSTQIYLLKRWLELQGLKVYSSEWNSSERVKTAP